MMSRAQAVETIERWVEQDTEAIVELCSSLIQCKTPSDPGDTRMAAEVVSAFLQEKGIAFEVVSKLETMPNIVATFDGGKPGKRFMFNGHLDTMPAGSESGWSDSPWSGKVEDGRIWGRGAQDMKAGVAAMLFAFSYLRRVSESLAGRVSISIVSDEESGWGRGTGHLFKTRPDLMSADCVLAGEPSGVDAVSFSSKGYAQASVFVDSPGGIAGYGAPGESAIERAAKVIADLDAVRDMRVTVAEPVRRVLEDRALGKELAARRSPQEIANVGAITIDVSTIKGGDFAYTIAPSCRMGIAITTPAGCDPQSVLRKIRRIVKEHPYAKVSSEGADAGDCSDPTHPFVGLIRDASVTFGGPDPMPVPDIALSDCRYWRYEGTPAFWYGPDGGSCSLANEHVEIEELLHLVRVYTLAVYDYLQA